MLALSTVSYAADQTATWNSTTGNWSDFTKWSTNPNFANNGNGGFTYDAIQNGGTLTVNQAITIQKYNLTGGTNTGAGSTLTLNELLTFSGGTMNGTGTVDASFGATLSGGNRTIADGRVLNLGGNSTWTGGSIFIGNNGQLVVASGATLDTSAALTITNNFSPIDGFFKIQGTFNKDGATTVALGAASGSFATENTGVVNVNGGTLAVQHRSTNTGDWNIANGATLKFDIGHGSYQNNHNLNAGTDIVGVAGSTVQFAGATTNFNAGTYDVAGTTQVIGGTVNFNAAAATSALTMSSGTLGGTATLTVSGATTISGGTLNGTGTVNASGGATLSGGTKIIADGRTLNLGGSSTWTGGTIGIGNNGQLVVLSGATLDASAAANITNTFSPTDGIFKIQGTFNKNDGTTVGLGTSSASFVTQNTGIVNVNGGTLNVTHVSTNTGTWNVESGAALNFSGNTHTMNAGSAFTGTGTVAFQSGTLAINAPVIASSAVQLTGATLSGAATLTLNGALTFSGGTMTGAGTINANVGATFSGAASKVINAGKVLNLSGNSTWTGGNIQVENNAQLIVLSGATLQTSVAADLSNFTHPTDGFFRIQGTFEKSGATTTNLGMVGGSFFTDNTGTISVTGGTLNLGGKLIQHSGTTLTAGTWNVSNGASINRTTGSDITTLGSAATVMLDGAGSSFTKVTTALATNQGSFTLKNNRDLTTAGAYANSGTTRVEDSTTVLTVNGAYTQTGGVTAMVGGAFIDPTVFNLNGGTLQGIGTIESNVIAGPGSHTIAPGLSPGTLTINGNLTLSSGSTLAMELGGLTQGTLYDHLDVNGVLTLAGMLDLDFINDFQNSLTNGEFLTLATADSAILGSFSNVASGGHLLTNFPFALQVWYGAGSPFGAENLVVVVPEPSRALLMMLGGMAVLHRRRRSMARPA
ncbi:MAG: PEP-CTERM sorting domain-containing protein [Verrucomicrobiaceae bacterium]|nr:PEP-CTERM sorting domain-containing protein [Verrucomicrobiaceae bacterium]